MTTTVTSSTDLILELERIERRAWADLYKAAADEVVHAAGIGSVTAGSAVGGIASQIDVLAFNRVLGLGLGESATESQIDQLVDAYTRANVGRFFVQLAPVAEPATLPDWLDARGFRHYNDWVKLRRGTESLSVDTGDVRVEAIDVDRAEMFADLSITAFEWPDIGKPWIAAMIGRPGWTFYLAFIDDRPVATGGMYVDGPSAWLDFASTHRDFRGRGAQTALIARRIRDAADAGATTLATETAADYPDKPCISKRNLIRCGFEEAYHRPNYLFEQMGDNIPEGDRQ